MDRKTKVGLAAILGVWLTAGAALPFVNVLGMFTPGQLMVFRGFLTAMMALAMLRGRIGRVDQWTYLIALVLPLATLGLFEGIRHWGAGPTIIVITATPIVNFAFAALLGRRVSRAAVVGLALLLVGVTMARWDGHFQWAGFLWSSFGTLMNGVLYECFARAKGDVTRTEKERALQKCFWACVGMGTLGTILSLRADWTPIADLELVAMVIGFAFVGGFLYWISNLVAFSNLETTVASVLAQGETPAVILGAYLLLGERLTPLQWSGVGIALYGSWYLGQWLKKKDNGAP